MSTTRRALLVSLASLAACGDDGSTSDGATTTPAPTSAPTTPTEATAAPTTTTATDATAGGVSVSAGETGSTGVDPSAGSTTSGVVDGTSGDHGTTGFKFDMGPMPDMGPPVDMCKVVDDMDAVGDCTDKAPPDSFDPEPQWTFTGPPGFDQCIVMPLVANLTDDNGDGEIDLCDTPDVVVVAGPNEFSDTPPSRLYVLDGLTGEVHYFAPELVQLGGTPALGDIDGDGLPEIVAPGADGDLIAFEHDGAVKWKSAQQVQGWQSSAVGLADVDADGDVEIFISNQLFDHMGNQLWVAGPPQIYSATAAADLDGQPGLEVLNGAQAFHADGAPYFDAGNVGQWVHAQVANFDDDPQPEVLLAKDNSIELRQHDGAMIWSFVPKNQGDLNRPINIHDFDGDQKAEFGVSSPEYYGVYRADHSPLWEAMITDESGQAGGTAFDFIGAGKAQAIYADEFTVWVFDENGAPLMSTPHLSGTIIEYPVVADIDNDGSAEILVVSNNALHPEPLPFTVQAVKDVEDRWVQGRRIWNQHTYHVTNVREDGTIPQHEKPHWQLLNTYRTQAQIGKDGVCLPPPQ